MISYEICRLGLKFGFAKICTLKLFIQPDLANQPIEINVPQYFCPRSTEVGYDAPCHNNNSNYIFIGEFVWATYTHALSVHVLINVCAIIITMSTLHLTSVFFLCCCSQRL